MRLDELPPEVLLRELEKRSDAYVLAADAEARAEVAHKALESQVYLQRRNEGANVEDSKMATRATQIYIDSMNDLITKQMAAATARAALDRAKISASLFQTVRADQRRI